MPSEKRSCETCYFFGVEHCDPKDKSAIWCKEYGFIDWQPREKVKL